MSQCDNWVLSATEQWCELKGDLCGCDGHYERCSMKDKAVAAALQQAESMTLRQTADRIRRNKQAREAG